MNRVPSLVSGWSLALICVVALGLALASFGAPPVPDPSTAANPSADDASAPFLVGRADTRVEASVVDEAATSDDDIARADGSADVDEGAAEIEDDDFAHMRDGAPLTAEHPLVAPVIEIQERYTGELMEHPLVVGTATGMNERGQICVVVLTKSEVMDLPAFVGGAPVMQYVTGELFSSKRGGNGGGGKPRPTPVDRTARFDRPVPIGVSTGHPSITAGTICCRVSNGTDVFALSNNHVYADENGASIGDDVIQPGTYDGGSSPGDDIGTLAEFVPIDFSGGGNTMDAAIAATTASLLDTSTPSDGYGTPRTTTTSASINLRVRKYGRTTGQTNGRVFAINATVDIGYSSGVAGFVGQIVITPGSFSAGGDSGSLIVVQKGGDARKPVALLFAGSSSATIASPIGPILTRFSVWIDGD